MRILHITTFLQGGAGRVIVALALAQHRAGHEVHVVADAGGESGYQSYPEYVEALAAAGVPLTQVHSTFKRDPALNRAAADDVRRLTRCWRPQVVHAHAATPSAIADLAGLRTGESPARLVHTMHGWGIAKTAGQAASDLARLRCADAVATPSRAAALALCQLGLQRLDITVIPYGIEPGAPAATPDPLDVAHIDRARQFASAGGASRSAADFSPVMALCIGTLGERKNQRLLVDALAMPASRHVVGVFIGDGDATPIHARARALDVAERVVVLGHRQDASRYLGLADALVLPSRNEGLPLVILEALRAGVPVVAARIPEIAEAVGDEHGSLLFETDDASALSEALSAATRSGQALRRSLRTRFRIHYQLERMVEAYGALYGVTPAPKVASMVQGAVAAEPPPAGAQSRQ